MPTQLLLFNIEPFTVQRESKRRGLYYKLTHNWTIDDIFNRIGYVASTVVGIAGIVLITVIPAPMPEKEARVREWVRRKDEDEEATPGETIRFIKRSADSLIQTPAYKAKRARISKRHRDFLLAQSKYQSFNN